MLKIASTLSIINMIAAARKLSATENEEKAAYLTFASKFGKNYTTR